MLYLLAFAKGRRNRMCRIRPVLYVLWRVIQNKRQCVQRSTSAFPPHRGQRFDLSPVRRSQIAFIHFHNLFYPSPFPQPPPHRTPQVPGPGADHDPLIWEGGVCCLAWMRPAATAATASSLCTAAPISHRPCHMYKASATLPTPPCYPPHTQCGG